VWAAEGHGHTSVHRNPPGGKKWVPLPPGRHDNEPRGTVFVPIRGGITTIKPGGKARQNGGEETYALIAIW